MNMQITPTQARLLAEARARRERFFNPPSARREIKPTPAPAPIAPAPVSKPDKSYDAHIVTWQMYRASGATPMRAFLETMAADEGVNLKIVLGKSRRREVAHTRQRYMYEIKRAFPNASLNQIGKLFGGRDHTTVLHAIRSHAERAGAPMLDTSGHLSCVINRSPAEIEPTGRAGLKGISWNEPGQKWQVTPWINGKQRYGGRFVHLADAIAKLEEMRNAET